MMGVGLSCTDLETLLMLLLLTKSPADLPLDLDIQGFVTNKETHTLKYLNNLRLPSRYHRILQKRHKHTSNVRIVTRLP